MRRRSGLAAPSVPLPRARARAHSATAVINNQASTAPIAVEAGCAPRRRTRTITTSAPSQRGSGIVQRRLPPTLDATGGGTRWTTGARGRTTERWRYGRRSSLTGTRSTPPYGRVAEGCGAVWPRWRCIRHSAPLGIEQDDGGPERRATPPDSGGLRENGPAVRYATRPPPLGDRPARGRRSARVAWGARHRALDADGA